MKDKRQAKEFCLLTKGDQRGLKTKYTVLFQNKSKTWGKMINIKLFEVIGEI